MATNYNLRQENMNSIITATDFVNTVTELAPNIVLLHLSAENIDLFRRMKLKQWENVPAVWGIRKSHVWVAEAGQVLISRTALEHFQPVA